MPLIDLLTTNAFTLGVQTDSYGNSLPRIPGIPPNGGWDTYFNVKNANYNQVGHSKNLKLPSSFTDMGTEQGWNNNRISWANDGGLVDVMADPTFVIGESHINDGIVDGTGGRGGQALQQDRRIIYTLKFTAKIYLYGPISSSAVIRKSSADLYTDTADQSPSRSERVTVTPNPSGADKDDTYTYTETVEFFNDGKNYDEETGNDT